MTCETTRQRLLRAERPDRPPADVQPHLTACHDCRAWQRRLTHIEAQILEVPVPSSAPPPELLRQLLNGPPPLPGGSPAAGSQPWWVSAPAVGQLNGTPPWWANPSDVDRHRPTLTSRNGPTRSPSSSPPDRTRRKVAVAFALTLGLAVFSLFWGLWSHTPPESTDSRSTYAVRQLQFDRRLAAVHSAKERLVVVADFAGELEREALASVRGGKTESLHELANLYIQIVRFRLPDYARAVPREERESALRDVAERLQHTESEMSRFLTQHPSHSASDSLREIAVAAREGQDRLWALLREV